MTPLLALSLALSGASPVQSLQEDLRTHPWRLPTSSVRPESSAVARPDTPKVQPTVSKSTAKPQAQPEGKWELQLGSLSSDEAAQQRKQELEAKLGSAVRVVQASGAWKLRWGSYPDKKAASQARETLKAKGVDSFPVEP